MRCFRSPMAVDSNGPLISPFMPYLPSIRIDPSIEHRATLNSTFKAGSKLYFNLDSHTQLQLALCWIDLCLFCSGASTHCFDLNLLSTFGLWTSTHLRSKLISNLLDFNLLTTSLHFSLLTFHVSKLTLDFTLLIHVSNLLTNSTYLRTSTCFIHVSNLLTNSTYLRTSTCFIHVSNLLTNSTYLRTSTCFII